METCRHVHKSVPTKWWMNGRLNDVEKDLDFWVLAVYWSYDLIIEWFWWRYSKKKASSQRIRGVSCFLCLFYIDFDRIFGSILRFVCIVLFENANSVFVHRKQMVSLFALCTDSCSFVLCLLFSNEKSDGTRFFRTYSLLTFSFFIYP